MLPDRFIQQSGVCITIVCLFSDVFGLIVHIRYGYLPFKSESFACTVGIKISFIVYDMSVYQRRLYFIGERLLLPGATSHIDREYFLLLPSRGLPENTKIGLIAFADKSPVFDSEQFGGGMAHALRLFFP